VTRCPHCQTSFRVRDEHLGRAGGKVRCGSCLQIFNCTEHLVTPGQSPKPTKEKTVPEQPTQQAAQQQLASTPSAGSRVTAATDKKNDVKAPQQSKSVPVPAEAQDDDNFDLEGQREVDANELFDSMFGSASGDDDGDNLFGADSSELGPGDFSDFIADEPVKPSKPVAEKVADDIDDDMLIHDDMDLDDDEIIDDPYVDLGLREPDQHKRPKPGSSLDLDHSLIDLEHHDDAFSFHDLEDHEDEEDEEAWAKALLDDDTPDHIQNELGLKPEPDELSSTKPVSSAQVASSRSESAQSTTKNNKPAATSSAKPTSKSAISFELADDQPEEQQTPSAPDYTLAPVSTATSKRQQELTGDLQATPLAFKAKAAKAKRSNTLWTSGSVLLLVLLASQTLFFNFDAWSRTPQWRPVYQSLCGVIGCQLPSIQNVSAMSTRNLVVRSHPDLINALVVDVLLQNSLDYAQPFPDLALTFTDINDNTVASRVFSPDEYLSGEASGRNTIPARTPVHVALEIVDPGDSAISYAIKLVGNQ